MNAKLIGITLYKFEHYVSNTKENYFIYHECDANVRDYKEREGPDQVKHQDLDPLRMHTLPHKPKG